MKKCIKCGCTDLIGCSNGCWWTDNEEDICSNCAVFTLEYSVVKQEKKERYIEIDYVKEPVTIYEGSENSIEPFMDGFAKALNLVNVPDDDYNDTGIELHEFHCDGTSVYFVRSEDYIGEKNE